MIDKIFGYLLELPALVQTAIVFVMYLLIKGGYISSKYFKGKKTTKPDHESCPNFLDFKTIMEKVSYKSRKIARIQEKLIMKEQMREVTITAREIVDIMRDNFSDLLDQTESTELQKLDARKAYKMIAERAVYCEAADHVREWMAKNHFTEKTDTQFSDYLAVKRNKIYEVVIREIKDNYLECTMIVPYEILGASIIPNISEKINPKIDHLFFYAREIAAKYEAEILEIENGLMK